MERREFLSSAVFSLGALTQPLREETSSRVIRAGAGGRCGPGEIEAVRHVTTAFTQADERLGGSHARSAVVEYLRTDAAAYCQASFARDTDRRAMLGAVAELAYLAGWKSHDAGLDGLAQRYYLASYHLAMEADPAAHAAYVLRILAHQAMDLGHHQHCADLAAEALTRVAGRVDPQTESLFWLTAARAHAGSGDRHGMLTSIVTAEQLIGRDPGDPGPRWASLGGPAQARFTNQAGQALRIASDLAGAERQLAHSASCWDPATYPRIHALTLSDVAETQFAQGKIEQACQTWSTALDGMKGVASARVRKAITSMRSRLVSIRGFPAATALTWRAEATLRVSAGSVG